jgi:hypothetical protein
MLDRMAAMLVDWMENRKSARNGLGGSDTKRSQFDPNRIVRDPVCQLCAGVLTDLHRSKWLTVGQSTSAGILKLPQRLWTKSALHPHLDTHALRSFNLGEMNRLFGIAILNQTSPTDCVTLMPRTMIPLRRDQLPPLYQQDAISWLQRFKNTELLQQMLSRFHFSEVEISAYRIRWAAWLKPKHQRLSDVYLREWGKTRGGLTVLCVMR